MRMPMRAGAIGAVALGLALAGCGSDINSGEATSAGTTSEGPTTAAEASGSNYTIVDYIRDNGIVETEIHRGDPGTPAVNLPSPPGWEDVGPGTPEWAWSVIVATDPVMAQDPPTIIALMSRLTGNVDPAKILQFAPGEIKNLPGYEGESDGSPSTLSGFDAYQISGSYVKDGVKRFISQKTVVIPGQDGLYVLQLNADAAEHRLGPLMEATAAIDEQITITP